MDHHRSVLQCPHYCLLPTKTFHHDPHQQVKVYCVKPGVGTEVSLTEGKWQPAEGIPDYKGCNRGGAHWGGHSRDQVFRICDPARGKERRGSRAKEEGNWGL